MRRCLLLALIAAGLAAAVLLSEGLLRLLGVSYPNFYTYDAVRGAALRPDTSGMWRKEGRARVRINSAGLRDSEHRIEKPEGTFRIAVLGDSFAEAFQVPQEKTFWTVLQQDLADCPALGGRRPEVLNFGVSGYGTAQELLTLRTRVWPYAPDAVLLLFTPGNDILDNSRSLSKEPLRPYFLLQDSRLILDDSFLKHPRFLRGTAPLRRTLRAMSAHSRILQLLYEAKRRWQESRQIRANAAAGGDARALRPFAPPRDPQWQEGWRVTEALLAKVAQEVSDHGAHFLLAVGTSGWQVHPDRGHRQKAEKLLPPGGRPHYVDDRLAALGRRWRFSVLPLSQEMLRHAQDRGAPLHGLSGEGHWNEEGHLAAGRILAAGFCASLPGSRP